MHLSAQHQSLKTSRLQICAPRQFLCAIHSQSCLALVSLAPSISVSLLLGMFSSLPPCCLSVSGSPPTFICLSSSVLSNLFHFQLSTPCVCLAFPLILVPSICLAHTLIPFARFIKSHPFALPSFYFFVPLLILSLILYFLIFQFLRLF